MVQDSAPAMPRSNLNGVDPAAEFVLAEASSFVVIY